MHSQFRCGALEVPVNSYTLVEILRSLARLLLFERSGPRLAANYSPASPSVYESTVRLRPDLMGTPLLLVLAPESSH